MAYLVPRFQVPMCAVCNRPVDYFEHFSDVAMKVERFTARCHGQTEHVEITHMRIAHILSGGISMGRAFEARQLEASNG